MKLETIKRNNKKKVIIGSMVVLSMVGCLTLTTSRAKYRSVQSVKLASGIVNYKASDLHLVAIKVSEDGTNYTPTSTLPEGNYTLNSEKSKCRIPTSTLIGEEAPAASGVTVEYTNGRINVLGLSEKNTKCYIYFDKVQSQTADAIIADIEKSSYFKTGTPTFSTIATGTETEVNNGIYKVEDGMYNGYSYYWRGAATTNHVIFDDKCWRIVRINGDKSIRLIYNGTPSENACSTSANGAAVIMGSTDAEKYYATSSGLYDKSYYVGWTYGSGQRTLSGTPSNAKYQTEKWYNNNISVAAKEKIDENGKFCNDRNIGVAPSSWDSGYATTYSVNETAFAYAGAKRLYEDYTPTLSCPDGDIYKLSVGAITADEVQFAGGKNEHNASYYLSAGRNYWTMTPNQWHNAACVFAVYDVGFLNWCSVDVNGIGVRPVINLRSDVTFNIGSDGTATNPYIVQ